MTPRTIVHVITRLDHGGSAQNTMLTALGHDRTRFAPIMIAGTADHHDAQGGRTATDANVRRLEAAGIACQLWPALTRPVSPAKDLQGVVRLVRLFRREQPALVHTHTSKAGALGRLAAALAGVKTVVHTPHGHVYYGHFNRPVSRVFVQIERSLARRTTRLIALTEAERDEHLAWGVGRAEQFAVIPSGIDLSRFRSLVGVRRTPPSGLSLKPDSVVVGSIGWLTDVKGHRYLIEAVAQAKAQVPTLHLLLVGSGDRRRELERLAGQRGIADAVTFAGERHDIPDCLAALDIFVLPSLNEGMGRALIEAMAAGRAVIASRVGGVPALIDERRNGLLVPPADPAALARALTELVRQPQWAKELGSAASLAIGARFSARAMVEAIESIYEDALNQTGAS